MSKHLHIISFDIPYPPNYGGVIDVYYKVKALHAIGVKVILHCFEYGREHAKELEGVCTKVFYYKRNLGKLKLFHSMPYIVASRNSSELIERLLKDQYPILFEGLHTCYHLRNPLLKKRQLFVRAHNIEHDYYSQLAKSENNKFRKFYFENEAKKLKRFETYLSIANKVFAISRSDQEELNGRYNNVTLLPPFHAFNQVNSVEGSGKFALYHGNLSVGENHQAAMYLVNNVFADNLNFKLIIAGNSPKAELIEAIDINENIELKSNISTEEIHQLIQEAHVNVLPTFQATGLKLKLLAALYLGRHCIVNDPMVKNTGLEMLCISANTSNDFKNSLMEIWQKPFEKEYLVKRKEVLNNFFSNEENAKILSDLL